ncbi:MAG: M3 family metallopeptidase [Gammaproteobacteria bacterium]
MRNTKHALGKSPHNKSFGPPNPPRGLAFRDLDPATVADDLLRRVADARKRVEAAIETDLEALIPTLELIDEDLDRRFAPLKHLNAVASTPSVRAAYERTLAAFTDYETWFGQHQGLYKAFKALSTGADFARRPKAEQTLVRHALVGFRLSGAELPPAEREAVRGLIAELSELGNRFETQLLDATDAWRLPITDKEKLVGLPEAATAVLAERARGAESEGWLLTLDPGVVDAVLTHAGNRSLRRQVYEAWVSRASDAGPQAGRFDNAPLIETILAARHRLAHTLGYENYADYALVERMARSSREVEAFLHDLAQRARPRADQEFAELSRFAATHGLRDPLAPWDIGYYSEKLREERYGFDEEMLRLYLPLERVIAGLRKLCRELYGLHFRSNTNAPVWHPDVMVWELTDSHGRRIGRLYIDLYARPGKRGGAWMDEGGHRLRLADVIRHPVAFLNANFMRPARGRPALIAHDDVVTLCHELGHCLHHLLSTVDYPSVGGINGVEWDAVEFPSQLHEEFAWHPAGLHALAAEVETGAPLPAELIEALGNSRRFQGALRLVRQLEFALFDLELHTLAVSAPDIADVRRTLADVRKEVRVTPLSQLDRTECSFAHIFAGSYAAGYYSYLWAEVMARDGFATFANGKQLNPEAGKLLARTVLAFGGSRSARELYRAFRGHDPDPAPLLALYGIT